MEDKDFCPIRRAFESSEHSHLEPPCTLVYLYMNDNEINEDLKRCTEHINVHKDIALGVE